VNEEEIERRLRAAFAARADGAVSEDGPLPAPRFADVASPGVRRHRARWLAPLAAAAAVLVVVGGVLAFDRDTGAGHRTVAGGHSVGGRTGTGPASATPTAATVKPVHIRLYNADGAQYGVGMPVVAIFSRKITDARPFVRATTVTVNGKAVPAAWYFENSAAGLGAMEAHLRPATYWPANAKIHVSLKTAGLVAGRHLRFDDALTLDFTTGARTVAIVDDRSHYLTVERDGTPIRRMRVSLGAAKTPTLSGVKVIMAKKAKVRFKGPGYDQVLAHALRLTYSGEYLVGDPAGAPAIQKGIDTSNGCTELLSKDAAQLYDLLQVGDPVEYRNATTPPVPAWDGFGDWNVPWASWLKGGLLPTS